MEAMMSHVLRMRGEHHRRLAELLRAAMPHESVAFLLCRRVQGRDRVVYLADEIMEIDPQDYAVRGPDIASVNPLAMARVAQRARAMGRVIAMAHLHPMVDQRVEFSRADFLGNRRSFDFFRRRVPEPEHLSLVWNAAVSECAGLAYCAGGASAELDSVGVVDAERWIDFVANSGTAAPAYSRQAMLLGRTGQLRLGTIHATVVGVGGLGSLVSLALIHHGIRHLTLVDDQQLDDTNLSRIPGSVPSDVGCRSKVDIAADYAAAHAPDAVVDKLQMHVEHPEALPPLVASDVIILCTDNTTSRAYINQVSQQYLVPILDLGVQFTVNKAGEVVNEIGRINLMRPGTPCLWCTGHINAERLAAESVPSAEREREGSYLRGFNDPQPSMLAFNMEVVARGVQILIGFVTGLIPLRDFTYEQRTFLRSKGGAMSRLIAKSYRAA
jgi:molybdopterin-synthase adenylyltransferase